MKPAGKDVQEYVFVPTAAVPIFALVPLHIVVSRPAFAGEEAITVITIVSLEKQVPLSTDR